VRTLVWFRTKDLRIADHAPLRRALSAGEVIPLFVLEPDCYEPSRARQYPHRLQILLEAVAALRDDIAARGSRLLLAAGQSEEVLPRLVRQWRVERVVAQRWVWPRGREREQRVAKTLAVPLELCAGETLAPAGELRTGTGRPYSVFTRFAEAFHERVTLEKPLPAPKVLPPLPAGVTHTDAPLPSLEALGLARNAALLVGGERAARERLRGFLSGPAAGYASERDRMDLASTSRLSADLKFGTLSVRGVWSALEAAALPKSARAAFQNELLWREFAYSTLWDRPQLVERPFRADFEGFPWQYDAELWRSWEQGRTGYPLVDAACRQLLAEGFVHNRARMVSASFLSKHLLISYQRGEAHYMKYLTDGDVANNNMGWQWSAGSGCDAQPFFRVFNPVAQGQKFDPEGAYVRRWVPELARLSNTYIHRPWQAPHDVLAAAGVELGVSYPRPVVDHASARERFLAIAKTHFKGSSG
jgi:deoxyribodipyrimidine photo-lyase